MYASTSPPPRCRQKESTSGTSGHPSRFATAAAAAPSASERRRPATTRPDSLLLSRPATNFTYSAVAPGRTLS